MDVTKITQGEAIATGNGAYVNGYAASSIECDQGYGARVMVAYVLDEFDGGQGPANAALYAEAHNVAQATGLSPEQMRDRLDEAVDVLKRAITSIGVYAMADAAKWTSYPQAQIRHMHKATEEYRAFLSKLKK